MTNRIGPMDQGILGKVGNKVDETAAGKTVAPTAGARDNATAKPALSGDTVNLTSSAKLLERLDKTLATLPGFDAARVADVKTAIENGDYDIDSAAIADALIRFEKSLGE